MTLTNYLDSSLSPILDKLTKFSSHEFNPCKEYKQDIMPKEWHQVIYHSCPHLVSEEKNYSFSNIGYSCIHVPESWNWQRGEVTLPTCCSSPPVTPRSALPFRQGMQANHGVCKQINKHLNQGFQLELANWKTCWLWDILIFVFGLKQSSNFPHLKILMLQSNQDGSSLCRNFLSPQYKMILNQEN